MSENNQHNAVIVPDNDTDELVAPECNRAEHNADLEQSNSPTVETITEACRKKATDNGVLIELQNSLSIVCCAKINRKDTNVDETMIKVHDQLFSDSTRLGCAEQLIKAEGRFSK